MSSLATMRADTTAFLVEWGEALLRRRKSVTYDNAMRATETWSSSLSFNGDFQALSGDEMQAEAGLQHKSDGKIIAEYDVDVVAGDRVIRGSDTFRCSYLRAYEEHLSAFVFKELNP